MVINDIAYNNDVRSWGQKTRRKLVSSIKQLTQKGKGDLVKHLRMKTKKDYGLVDRVTYQFPRHGVFFHKGTGKGYKITGGVLRRVPSGKNKTLTSSSIKRVPAEWFNPVINDNVDSLADMVAKHMADAAVNATRLKIN